MTTILTPVSQLAQEDVILIEGKEFEVIDDREFEVWALMPANPITLQCPPIGGVGQVLRQDVSLEFLEVMFPSGVPVIVQVQPGKPKEAESRRWVVTRREFGCCTPAVDGVMQMPDWFNHFTEPGKTYDLVLTERTEAN